MQTFIRDRNPSTARTPSTLRIKFIVIRDATKRTGSVLAIIGAILIAMTTQVAAQITQSTAQVFSVVYPTGVFPGDVQNVQTAVDGGGTVFLRAVNAAGVPTAFNFGTAGPAVGQSGAVSLSTDVNIVGEQIGPNRATINGGFAPFRCLVPIKSMIHGIDFESPFDDAIAIIASTGSEISGNRIHNVVPIKVRVPSGRIITFADGIDFSGSGNAQQAIRGKVRVSDNVIDGLGAIFSNGIQFDSVGADSEITGNSIQNVNSVNTVTGGGITVIRSQKLVFISNNLIVPGPGTSGGPGIFIDGDHDALYQIISNKIICDGPFGDGIDVAGGNATRTTGTVGAVITDNQVTLHNGLFAGGILLFDLVTDSHIQGNAIEGDGFAALAVTTFGFNTDIASLNRFIANDIGGFNSSFADVFFDTNAQNNLVVGDCKSVIDLGVGNSATCNEQRTGNSTGQPNTLASGLLNGTPAPAAAALMKQQWLEMFTAAPHTQRPQ